LSEHRLSSPWRDNIERVLAASPLNDAQRKSLEQRFDKLSDVAALLEKSARASKSDDARNDLEDLNLACRTLLTMNPRIEEEASTWALLTGSRPRNSRERIRALGLDVFSEDANELLRVPHGTNDVKTWHSHAASRLRRLVHALLAARDFHDVVIIAVIADCELARIVDASSYRLLLS
jgi:hypothetical protein